MSGLSGSDSTFQHPPKDHYKGLPAHRVAVLDTRIGARRDADSLRCLSDAHLLVVTPCPQQVADPHGARVPHFSVCRSRPDSGGALTVADSAPPFPSFHHHDMNARFSPALQIREKASQPAVRPYRGQLTRYSGPVDHWRAFGQLQRRVAQRLGQHQGRAGGPRSATKPLLHGLTAHPKIAANRGERVARRSPLLKPSHEFRASQHVPNLLHRAKQRWQHGGISSGGLCHRLCHTFRVLCR